MGRASRQSSQCGIEVKRSPLKRSRMKPSRRKTVPNEIRDHWGRVSKLGCCISGKTPATIHHVHGGSIIETFGKRWSPGMGQKQNDWLVIPLAPEYHTGHMGIDNGQGEYKGVAEWEVAFGTQAQWLEAIRVIIWQQFGYCIYERAGLTTVAA
jgi:hypothetical protein